MLWQGLSLLPLAAILGVCCHILHLNSTTRVSSTNEPKPTKAICFFAAMLVLAAVCLVIAAAFDEPAVMPSMPGGVE
jgi:hypothetical protein